MLLCTLELAQELADREPPRTATKKKRTLMMYYIRTPKSSFGKMADGHLHFTYFILGGRVYSQRREKFSGESLEYFAILVVVSNVVFLVELNYVIL
jgi:hypothetical protein